jgi:polysaccharide export outer membrane protein
MLSGNKIFRRLRRCGLLAAAVGIACCSLQAQSDSSAQPASSVPSSTPVAPVGTSFAAASGNTPVRADTTITPAVSANYQIGTDDVLTINVWHEPEVSRNVPVRPDGKISLPLVGDVQAAGLTPTQLQSQLESRFSKFLTDPAVSVIVAEIRSQRINVLGQVLRPGTYALVPPMSVIDAVAAAGGLKEFAKANKIYVLRTLPNGQRERIKFQYKNVLKGKHGSQDVLLDTRDTVVVP